MFNAKSLIFLNIVVAILWCLFLPIEVSRAETPVSILIPLYAYPTIWNNNYQWPMVSQANKNGNIIGIVNAGQNPTNGPGGLGDPNSDYRKALNDISGVRLLGYVRTTWGNRDINDVKRDIDKWKNDYSQWVKYGIFLDEAAVDCIKIDYYKEIYRYIHNLGFLISVINPGMPTNECYYQQGIADTIVMFENTVQEWSRYSPPIWMQKYPADKSATLIYGETNATTVANHISKAAGLGFGYIYITADDMPNPWDFFPLYLGEQAAFAASQYPRGPSVKQGDYNQDNNIDVQDLIFILNNWGSYNIKDIVVVLNNWSK